MAASFDGNEPGDGRLFFQDLRTAIGGSEKVASKQFVRVNVKVHSTGSRDTFSPFTRFDFPRRFVDPRGSSLGIRCEP